MNKIYVDITGPDIFGNYAAIATDKHGILIGRHTSSDKLWAEDDIVRPSHIKEFEEYYPDGYEIEFVNK